VPKKQSTKRSPARPPRAARPTVTIDLGKDVLFMLDALCLRLQKVSLSPRKVTRSAAIREAIICLHEKRLQDPTVHEG